MKKNLFFAALAVVAMVSCAKNEAVDPSASTVSEAIGFETFIDRTTKGSVTTASSLQDSGFSVIAYNFSTEDGVEAIPFGDDEVTYANGAWSYGATQYWADGDDISFYAYAPTAESSYASYNDQYGTEGEEATATLAVVTEAIIANQADIVVATSLNNTYAEGESATPINLNFNHILSKIGFTAQAGVVWDETEGAEVLAAVTLKSVEVEVLYNSDMKGLISEATYNMVSGAWEFATETLDLEYLEVSEESISSNTINATDGFTLLDEPSNVTNTDGYLMIIPQELKSDEVIKVTATYDQDENTDLTKEVYVPTSLISTFEQGKQYTLNLLIGDQAIRFSTVTVTDFADGDYTM